MGLERQPSTQAEPNLKLHWKLGKLIWLGKPPPVLMQLHCPACPVQNPPHSRTDKKDQENNACSAVGSTLGLGIQTFGCGLSTDNLSLGVSNIHSVGQTMAIESVFYWDQNPISHLSYSRLATRSNTLFFSLLSCYKHTGARRLGEGRRGALTH